MITLNDISTSIDVIKIVGNVERIITHPVQANGGDFDDHSITWIGDKYLNLMNKVNSGAVICSVNATEFSKDVTYIIVPNPRKAFSELLNIFFVKHEPPIISDRAFIDKNAIIGENVTIGHYSVIESGCVIGDNTTIGSNTAIKRDSKIGSNVKIGSNCTIGGVGFGYEKDIDGNYILIPHLGNVVIENHVEIGNNTCIDRAVLGSTILHENVKVDNLVHIAHGVKIGNNSLIIAHAMIGGSTTIGENVWFAPSASVLNKKIIENNAIIGMAAVVVKDVKQGETIVGNPGKVLVKQ